MARPLEHGDARASGRAAEYRIWLGIKQRCFNANSTSYPYYGGRGISMCWHWQRSYQNFLKDMGRRPSPKHSIDRKNPNGAYCKRNCRWATKSEQQQNTRRTKHTGIYWNSSVQRWWVRLPADANGDRKYVGKFKTEQEAIAALRTAKNRKSRG